MRDHINGQPASEFMQLCSKTQSNVVLSKATVEDLDESPPAMLEAVHRQLEKYHILEDPFGPIPEMITSLYPEDASRNDVRDQKIIHLLSTGAADYLVTEDRKLRAKARKIGLVAYLLEEVIDILRSSIGEAIEWLDISENEAHRINLGSEVFSKLRNDYEDFPSWWREKVIAERRQVFVLGDPSDPEGLSVIKDESNSPEIDLAGKVLKICTFFVQDKFAGSKRGERLLFFTLNQARKMDFDVVYMTTAPSNEKLIHWSSQFGFQPHSGMRNNRGEVFLVKKLTPDNSQFLSPLDHNITYGPGSVIFDRAHVVPIQEDFAFRLFPEAMGRPYQIALPGLENRHPSGFAIRKVYVCNSGTRDFRKGDLLLFLVTGSGDKNEMVAVGVLEDFIVTHSTEKLFDFSQTRTIFDKDELEQWCSDRDALGIKFRLDRVLDPSITISRLKLRKVLTTTPQSITHVKEDGIKWLQDEYQN